LPFQQVVKPNFHSLQLVVKVLNKISGALAEQQPQISAKVRDIGPLTSQICPPTHKGVRLYDFLTN